MMRFGEHEVAKNSVGCAALLGVMVGVVRLVIHFVPVSLGRNQAHNGRQVIGIDNQQAVLRVVCITAPGHATYVARDGKRAWQTGWSKKAIVAETLEKIPANLAVFRSDAPRVIDGKFLRRDRGRRYRKRLRG